MKLNSITTKKAFAFLSLVTFLLIFSVGNASAFGGKSHDGCFNLKVRFSLETTFESDGSVTLTGPVRGGLLHKATLNLTVRPEDIQPTVGGLAPASTIAVLAKGAYALRNGDQIFIEVINVTDNVNNVAAGIQNITGGTGYFKGATGTLPGTGFIEDGIRKSEVEGKICLGG